MGNHSKANQTAKLWRERQKSLGLCVYCNRPSVSGKTRCEYHKAKGNVHHKEWMQTDAGKNSNRKSLDRSIAKRQEERNGRRRHQKRFLDETVFDDAANREDAAYWIGFLMADGCISSARKRDNQAEVILALHRRDREHIDAFKRFLGASNKIGDGINNIGIEWSRISVFSNLLVSALQKHGVTPRKSKTAKCIGLETNRHFWRGVIDGDGCICFQKQRRGDPFPIIEVCGSRCLMDQYQAFCRQIAPDAIALVRPKSSIWKVCISGLNALLIIRELYKDCQTALPRKLLLAKKALLWKQQTL